MKRTYHNAGPAGRDFSRLELWPEFVNTQACARIEAFGGPEHAVIDVILTSEQIRDLAAQLNALVDKHTPLKPMIEGADFTK